jgi:hypothetical protein
MKARKEKGSLWMVGLIVIAILGGIIYGFNSNGTTPLEKFLNSNSTGCWRTGATTTMVDHHWHEYCPGDIYTKEVCDSVSHCHKHKLNYDTMETEIADGHQHSIPQKL